MRRKGEVDPVDQYQESLPADTRFCVEQYRQLTGAAQRLWQVIYDHTTYREWEQDGGQGVGSCYINEDVADQNIYLSALHAMRRQRYLLTPGEPATYTYQPVSGSPAQHWLACAYHRANVGCSLGDLKGPLCIGYISPGLYAEIKHNYGVDVAVQLVTVMQQLEVTLILLQDREKPQHQRTSALDTTLTAIVQLQTKFERVR